MKALILALLLMFPCSTFASVAMVVASKGDVVAINENGERPLTQGAEVDVSDMVRSGPRSFVVLQFVDGAKVTVRPESKVFINTYSYGGHDDAQLDLVSGGLRILTGSIAKNDPDNYRISTPVALMGVRGTEFSIYLLEDGQNVVGQVVDEDF